MKNASKTIPATGETPTGNTPPLRGHTLGWLTRAALPDLQVACAEVDGLPQFVKSPEHCLESRILQKLDAYRAWLKRNGLRPPVNNTGVDVRRILQYIGHPQADVTNVIRAALKALNDTLPPEGQAFEALGDSPADRAILAFGAKMKSLARGLPRHGPSGRFAWIRAAKDIGCAVEELTETRKTYLKAIDAIIDLPGDTVDVPCTHWDKSPRNAAVPVLLAAELQRRQGAMPADPLHPTMIDVITIAEGAGVTVRDITGGPMVAENRAAMETACAGEALRPHPLVAARRFTIKDLKEFGRTSREAEARSAGIADPAASARMTVRALTQFLGMPKLGGKTTDLVPLDFPLRIEQAVALRPGGFGSGWAAQMARWVGYYHALRSERPLPETFATAIRMLAAEAGVSVYQIIKDVGTRALNWINGLAFPTLESEGHVRKLESLLLVTPGTLSRLLAPEWRSRRLKINLSQHGLSGISRALPANVAEQPSDEQLAIARRKWERHVRQETEFANRLSEQLRDRYRLPFKQWPAIMQQAWNQQTPELNFERPEKDGDLRLPGTRPRDEDRSNAKKEEDRSWRPLTEKMAERMLGYFFGYLVRPRAADEADRDVQAGVPQSSYLDPSDKNFDREPGLGMPHELVHPALFAVIDLMTGFSYWKRRRSGGRFAPTVGQTLLHAAEFLKPGSGIVWKNKSFLRHLERFKTWWETSGGQLAEGSVFIDIDAFRENWEAAVEEAYNYLLGDIKEMKTTDPKRKKIRKPFIPIQGYLDANDPMVPYMVGVRQMLASRPLGMVDRHRHNRNGILTLILLQTGLRAATLLLTIWGEDPTLRREITSDGTVRWRIRIPAVRFKNFSSPFFSDGQPYDFILEDEDGLYNMLEEYVARGRPYLLNGRQSDALFIGSQGGDYTAVQLSHTYRIMTGIFFVRNDDAGTGIEGVRSHGLHAVRHIIATSLLRTTGDIYIAAWAIQDTARTVEQHYVDFLPRNKALLAVEHLRKSRTQGLAKAA
jgi:hypothetical protein